MGEGGGAGEVEAVDAALVAGGRGFHCINI